MDALRVLARRAGLSFEQSRFLLGAARSMSPSAIALHDVVSSLPARRSRSDLAIAAEPSVPVETPVPTTTAELSTSPPTRGLVLGSAASEVYATAPSSSSCLATPFGIFGSAAACATAPTSSSAASFGFVGSAAATAPSPSATRFGSLRFPAASSISCSSSAAASIGCPCGFSATTPSSSTALGRALGISSSARRYSTSSSSSRPSPTAVDAVLSEETNNTSGSESTITYAHGMFDDVNDGKWMPFEYFLNHMPIEKVKLVGDKLDEEYSVLSEVGGKGLFASLILLIEKMSKHGYSFLHLTLSQLMVDKYGQFVIAEGAILQKSSKRVMSNAYFNCAAIFESIIRHTSGNSVDIPLGFRDLLKLLRKTRTPHGYIMLAHPSLMPLHTHSQAFLDVYDYVMDILPDDKAKVVVEALCPSAAFWDNILKRNELLQEWFKHKSCSRFDTKNPWDLLTYLTNVHSHSLAYQGTMRYTKDDVRLLVQCKFPRVMSTLYWKLWEQKVLPGIETETYFCLALGCCCPKPGFCLRRELRLLVKPEEVDKMMMAPRKTKKKS